MEKRIVDQEITLIPYYPNPEVALAWYQDPDVCMQVDHIDHVYTPELLNNMYTYLSTHGACYYIEYRGTLVGDVSLRDNEEISIVVCKEYQNLHIGRRCIVDMLALAREKGLKEVKANIYAFNTQSQKAFEAVGFRKVSDEWYSCPIQTMNQDELITNEHFPKDKKAPARTELELILQGYGIQKAETIKLIDSTRDADDIRLNYIIDKKYVLRFCCDSAMTEARLQALVRLIHRYHAVGIQCPAFICHPDGKYLHYWSTFRYYLSEYVDLAIASDVYLEDERSLNNAVTDSVAQFAEKYRNVDLSDTFGMYSLFDLSPFDREAGMDEKEENFRCLMQCLRELNQNHLADRLQSRYDEIRSKIKGVYQELPRCVFQGDENFSNVLLNADGSFAGFIDFNLAGTEVIVNQLANLAGFDYEEEQTVPQGADRRLQNALSFYRHNAGRLLQIYHATVQEQQAMVWYAWIVMVCQWPTLCWFRKTLKEDAMRDEILALLSLIADLPENALYI